MKLDSVVATLSVFVLLGLPVSPTIGQESKPGSAAQFDCSYDRKALLALDQRAFDQDLDGGWRAIARSEPCIEVAADLIRDYRQTHSLESEILYWHEGQLRAQAGANEEAIELFERTHRPREDPSGWNQYVDATIAFLQDDRVALLNARGALSRLPRPPGLPTRNRSGNPISWPPNLNVVDMLVACFGRPYKEAYGGCEQ